MSDITLRTFPEKPVSGILARLKEDTRFLSCVTSWVTIPEKKGSFAPYPDDISESLKSILCASGCPQLYTHQEAAYRQVRAGSNTVVVTPTASGKTLCYNLPVLQGILEAPESRALYLFPTKALSQDQMTELRSVTDQLEQDIKTYTFDGDTPVTARKAIRSSGHIVVTNPDMLHQGILPHHTRWIKLFENLRYVVIDEIHHYRGVFGSHLANVIRRLKRICAFYGSSPVFICCSATIANPRELAEKIVEQPVSLVDESGAPAGEKHIILYNPPVIDKKLGIRRSMIKEAAAIAQRFLLHGVQTILFTRSRINVEILTTYLRAAMEKNKKGAQKIAGYRGGYLPKERRAIERGLKNRDIYGVVSTTALELGIDIGRLDACIMAGYPGTIASTWQQAGRTGRKAGASAAVLVASSSPLDQYIINHPDYFFQRPPENGVINPDNLVILMSHVKCAAFELPFEETDRFGIDATDELLTYLSEHGVLHKQESRFHWTSDIYPAEEVSLRSATPENFVIIDTTGDRNQVIGEMDLYTAPMLIHDEAIYYHQSRQYHVDKLDWDRRKAYVRAVDVDYYTDAEMKTDIKVLDILSREPVRCGEKAHGEISVTTCPTMYKKIKLHTHENVGFGKLALPELEMHTTSYLWHISGEAESQLRSSGCDFAAAMRGLGNIMATVAPLYLMCDPRDICAVPMLKSPFSQQPTLFVYDSYPGGVGFSEKLFDLHQSLLETAAELIRRCSCKEGCPSCVGPVLEVGERGKQSAALLIEMGLDAQWGHTAGTA